MKIALNYENSLALKNELEEYEHYESNYNKYINAEKNKDFA